MDWLTGLFTWKSLIAFLTLVALELVLGVDNVIFISILAGKLPQDQQGGARRDRKSCWQLLHVSCAPLALSWLIRLDEPLFTVFSLGISGKDLDSFAGGLFLIWKSTREIHEKLEGTEGQASAKVTAAFWNVVIQIMLLDIVFSLDSVITDIGMVNQLAIMIAWRRHRGDCNGVHVGTSCPFCRASSHHQDAGFKFPVDDRLHFRCRGLP